jgi:ERCC4-type nuclease
MEAAAAPQPATSSVFLIIDTRERAVLPFLETALQGHAHVRMQVHTGDYLVCAEAGVVLACVERKTLPDFGASLRDGRYERIENMKALRAKTGCRLFFLLEGPAFPEPARRFGRVPYAAMLAAVTRLMACDGFCVLQTRDACHTAKRLADLLCVYEEMDSRRPQVLHAADAALTPATPLSGMPPETSVALAPEASETPPCETPPCETSEAPPNEVPLQETLQELLAGQLAQTDAEAAAYMWARLHGVTLPLGKTLSRCFSVAALVSGGVAADRLRGLKMPTGRAINRGALKSLLAVRAGTRPQAVKLVSGVRGVSPTMAAAVLQATGGLAALCTWEAAQLAELPLPRKSQTARLGRIRAERICRLLRYQDPTPAPARPPAALEPVLTKRDAKRAAKQEAKLAAKKAKQMAKQAKLDAKQAKLGAKQMPKNVSLPTAPETAVPETVVPETVVPETAAPTATPMAHSGSLFGLSSEAS